MQLGRTSRILSANSSRNQRCHQESREGHLHQANLGRSQTAYIGDFDVLLEYFSFSLFRECSSPMHLRSTEAGKPTLNHRESERARQSCLHKRLTCPKTETDRTRKLQQQQQKQPCLSEKNLNSKSRITDQNTLDHTQQTSAGLQHLCLASPTLCLAV